MMNFVKLTCARTGRPEYVRADLITAVLNTDRHSGSIVYLRAGNANAEVTENPDQVMSLVLAVIQKWNY